MSARLCLIVDVPACAWTPHAFKHFPYEGMKREDTRRGPARYLDASMIQATEAATARQPGRWRGEVPLKTEYLREVDRVIGWDQGADATLSFVECSGGATARAFHGRPMQTGNPKNHQEWNP